jgi:hypothetical protein
MAGSIIISSAVVHLYPFPLCGGREREPAGKRPHPPYEEEDGEVIILVNRLIAARLEPEEFGSLIPTSF